MTIECFDCSRQKKTLRRGFVVVAGADLGIWVVSAWSFHTIHFWPTGYASSSVPRISLRIHHNRLGSMEVIAIPLVCCLSDLSASIAHAVVCSFYRQKPRRQHLCIAERLLDCCCGAHSQQFKLYTITPKHQREVFIVTTSMTPLAYLPQPFPSMSAACLNRPR